MGWTKSFYTRQYELLKSPAVWATFSPDNLPDRAINRAAAVERLSAPGRKQVLELGCGGGVMATAIALRGNSVVAVDIVDAAVAGARRLATQLQKGSLTVVHGDFYEIALEDNFDVACYFDGFGIGVDADQRRLLRRIAGWLKPGGCALIDIYCPWRFANNKGETYQEGNVMYRSGFDADGCRLEESIWLVGEDESQAVTQSLRCYSPADLRLLLEGTGLALYTIEPYASAWDYDKPVSLKKAEIYLTKLVHEG
jgi:SAM-dependent methyltransferase